VAACSTAAQQARTQSPTDVVATVGSTTITLAQVDEQAMQQPAGSFGNVKLAQALYQARHAALEELIGDALIAQEAAARGIDRNVLVQQEILSKAAAPTDEDVNAFYRANQERLRGATLDQVRSAIGNYLTDDRKRAAREAYVERLKGKTAVRVMLEAPRSSVSAASGASKGPADAPVEIIEFSDFQCPYCLSAHPTVKRLLDTYGDRVHFVYRHYPLPNHPNARPAAEASQCANEQGKFWPYHDRLFANPTKLSDADLKRHAAELGLDSPKFDACFDSHKFKSVIDADVKTANELGVNGTPAFFINGRMVSGAQPFEVFKRVIDEELEFKKR
jgi:protein-disulfide isomerase